MRSKLVIGGLCAAVALLVGAAPAYAQSELDLDSGRLKVDQCRSYNITTSSSVILDIVAQAFQTIDLDITITVEDGDDADDERDVYAESVSTTVGYERLAIGLPGSSTFEITICNEDNRTSRFTASFSTLASPGVNQGPARVQRLGEFVKGEPSGDPVLAAIQRTLQERDTKR